MTEEKLLSRLRQGDTKALEILIDRYNAYVCSIVTMILDRRAEKEDVEELVSDVFLSIWNHANALRPGKVKLYIGAAARNTAKSFLRKSQTLSMDQDELIALTDETTPENQFLKQEQQKLIRAAILGMPQPDREIFLRYYYYLQTSEQIGEEMGMTAANIRSRLMRGRNRLKQALWKEDIL